ncbi:MAG: hypothetical protein DRP93_07995 [Candidatus Neomarinimicrobiota bacterium]|nr:MAG: hypothetical protein DRP93_07995 [Candidatus Neomarinimicrobiota bacterium]
MKENKIEFKKILVSLPAGSKAVNTLYYVVDNGRLDIIENLEKLAAKIFRIVNWIFAHMIIKNTCKSDMV